MILRIFTILLPFYLLSSCTFLKKEKVIFKKVSPSFSGIDFNNVIFEDDTLNYFTFPYMYLGGGVSIGDINNDDLPDIYFTGNIVPNKLYLNKGDFKFEDITIDAGVEGGGQWFTGSTMADVNNDGYLDIYVCVSKKYKSSSNLLYINNGDNTFSEKGAEYGVDDVSSSVQATFFDYDNDGDLDLFVVNYPIILVSMGAEFYHRKIKENKYEESAHLYRNNGNGSFTDATTEAGVQNFGMSLGVVASDLNNDGWKDLYVSNDFNGPDYLYLNNCDGTFREVIKESTNQTSIFGMGVDAADINNDGLIDIYQADMTPEDHIRANMNLFPLGVETYFQSTTELGFHYQYMFNSLQVNCGVHDSLPLFSNIAQLSGTARTDWSWGGQIFDIDNDGLKDIIVSNGVLRDINDRDVLGNSGMRSFFGQMEVYRPELFPSVPVKNYTFKNNGDYTFSNNSDAWGIDDPGFSNGMAYGDLDNDGDLDVVFNNMNDVPGIYKNSSVDKAERNFLKIKLRGSKLNPFGFGTIANIYTKEGIQKMELTSTRGFQSSVNPEILFGLGSMTLIDSLDIIWPDGKNQKLAGVHANQILEINYTDATEKSLTKHTQKQYFKDITANAGIYFLHQEDNYNDFKYERLLPHQNSRIGPGLAVGDINSDGLDDFFIGNAKGAKGCMYVQDANGVFHILNGPWENDSVFEDTGALLFDANGDERLDLYLVSGGNFISKRKEIYQDRLYLNTADGFVLAAKALPINLNQSGACVVASDYDQDGDIDLFVGGRIVPSKYPLPANSYLLTNTGEKGLEVKFENNTATIAPGLSEIGLVTDAVWNDHDADGDLDLLVVGEWMYPHLFENTGSGFLDKSEELGLTDQLGWYYHVNASDVDQDGDVDYLFGNLGLNYKYKTSAEAPLTIYSNDFDENGKLDIVLSYKQNEKNYPTRGLDCSSEQLPVLKARYKEYLSYAESTIEDIYGSAMLEKSLQYRATNFAHYYLQNRGDGEWNFTQLPNKAQFSSINASEQLSYKGKQAILLAGNLYATEPETPRVDAGLGLVMVMDSAGFKVIPPQISGLFVQGEVKDIKEIKLANGNKAFLFAINDQELRLIEYIPD